MSINNVGSYQSSFYSPEMASQNLQGHKLEASKDINMQEMAAAKSASLADLGATNIDLSKFSDLSDKSPINLNLVDYWGNSIDTNGLENFLNSISLDQEQISALQNGIDAASKMLKDRQTDSGTYGMRICQTNMELKCLSENLLPGEYRDKFNAFVDDYTKQVSDSYVNFLKNFAEQLAGRTDSVSIQTGWQEKGEQMLESLENGSDDFQLSLIQYRDLYNGIDISDTGKAKEQLDSLYQNLLSNAGGDSQSSWVREIKNLSDSWNDLMSVIGKGNNQFTTSVDCLA